MTNNYKLAVFVMFICKKCFNLDVGDAKFFENKMKQPHRADQKILNVFQKGWFLALDFMTNKLDHPSRRKNGK
jgi:hypothetical protein